jgi:16S rRNA processing protein RimM
MQTSDCFYLGYIKKPFGYKGEVSIVLDVDEPDAYKELESVFVLLEGKLVPFFIAKISFRPNSHEAVVQFRESASEEKALQLSGCELYLPSGFLPPLTGNKFYFHEVIGFEVHEATRGRIGKLTRILDYPGNPVFQINEGNKEILVPARDEFIVKLDREEKKLYLETPEGLIDLYLSDL